MLQDVMTALRAGDAATALATATRWTTAEPGNADALLSLAHARAAGGDATGAREALDRALLVAPQRADLLTLRAYLDLQDRDLGKAEAGLTAALAQDPNQLGAYLALAPLALARGDRAEATRLVSYAKRIDPEHPRLLVLEAQLAAADGQPDRVLPLLTAAAERAPNDAMVISTLGLAFFERQHFAFAAEALRKALALSQSAPILHAPLIAALEAQNLAEPALAQAEAWLAREPASVPARWERGRLLARMGRAEAALADVDAVQAHVPRHARSLELGLQLRRYLGGMPAALEGLEARIAADPTWSLPWRFLISVSVPAAVPGLLQRWQAAAPDSGEALEAAALLAERSQQVDEALALARRAVALEPRLQEARLLQARIALASPPDEAVSRIESLMAEAVDPAQTRALAGWLGAALHRAGRHPEALMAWRRMWLEGPSFGLPLPNPEPAHLARPTDDGGAGRLLWGPPGSRVERVQAALQRVLGQRLLSDRWQQTVRDDGFNLLRVAPDDALAGTAARWRAPLEAAGLDPATVVDALPSWDGWTQATLHGTTLVAVLRDPRDLLLNWLAWGSPVGLNFPSPGLATAWLHRLLDQVLEAEAQRPGQVVRIDADLLDRDPEAFAARLAEVFDLPEAPDVTPALLMGFGPHGQAADFPAGAWRQYREPLKALFGPLGELAVRLGYPAE